jgi:hypothetical protein
LLQRIINMFPRRLHTTPNILTEVSGMMNQVDSGRKAALYRRFSEWIDLMNESYVESREVARDPHFAPFGLTDLGIARLSRGSLLVLTADSRLAAYLNQLGVEAVDFQALRHLSRP